MYDDTEDIRSKSIGLKTILFVARVLFVLRWSTTFLLIRDSIALWITLRRMMGAILWRIRGLTCLCVKWYTHEKFYKNGKHLSFRQQLTVMPSLKIDLGHDSRWFWAFTYKSILLLCVKNLINLENSKTRKIYTYTSNVKFEANVIAKMLALLARIWQNHSYL